MQRYRLLISTVVLTIVLAGLSFGQGPLTNALNLMLRSDSNGALYVYGVVAGAQGPLTNLGNLQLRAYSPGSLAVTVAGGTITPDNLTLAAAGTLTWIGRSILTSPSNGLLTITNNAASSGIGLDVTTDGTLIVRDKTQSSSGSINFNSASVNGTITMTGNGNLAMAGGDISGPSTHLLYSHTVASAPVACTSPSITWGNGTAAFQVGVGTSCAGISTLVVTMPTVTNAWVCDAINVGASATAEVEMTASTTNSVTFTNYTRTTGIALAWVDSASVRASCWGG